MKRVTLLFIFLGYVQTTVFGQATLPYSNSFTFAVDTVDWISTGDWEWGAPIGTVLNTAPTPPNAWGTNLDGIVTPNSTMYLYSPSFNLSGTINYKLSFFHRYKTGSATQGGNLQYSTDGGITWNILNGSITEKYNWHSSAFVTALGGPGWNGNAPSILMSSHSLAFLTGNVDVRFRFQYSSNFSPDEGWVIDDFSIAEDLPNIVANIGTPLVASALSANIIVTSTLNISNLPIAFNNKTDYYFSTDNVYNLGDIYLGSKSGMISGSITNYTHTLNMIPGLLTGNYFILYHHESNNIYTESSESDNWSYISMQIDSTYSSPNRFNFDNGFQNWQTGGTVTWQNEPGSTYNANGQHSGQKGLYVNGGSLTNSYAESPFMDFTTTDSVCINTWFAEGSGATVMYSIDNSVSWVNFGTPVYAGGYDWYFSTLLSIPALDSTRNVKLRYYGTTSAMDDIYIGKCLADLSISNDRKNRFTSTSELTDTISYYLINSGKRDVPITQTDFYWSTDTIFDVTDVFIGSKNELPLSQSSGIWTTFEFSKPTTTPGVFYIFYILDVIGVVNEMWEGNDTGFFYLHQPIAQSLPYYNDFETQIDGWHHKPTVGDDQWTWNSPANTVLNSAYSGTKVWITNQSGYLTPYTRNHLYTTVFDFSSTVNPVIEFDMKSHINNSNMSYSIDDGMTWNILDTTSRSWNRWYYLFDYEGSYGMDILSSSHSYTNNLFTPDEPAFLSYNQYNTRNVSRVNRYILDIGFLAGQKRVQFRYNVGIKENTSPSIPVPTEGILIDNFSIREAFSDLGIKNTQILRFSEYSGFLRFNYEIKNFGNFESDSGFVEYYVSSDTILDASDTYLATDLLFNIRPDFTQYFMAEIQAPPSWVGKNYLLFNIDSDNSTIESNESNNVVAWPVVISPIDTFPYLANFNDTIVIGWAGYSKFASAGPLHRGFRFRNMLVPAEYIYQTKRESGRMSTDLVNPLTVYIPYFYLESPTFDFSDLSIITLSFDLSCAGNTSTISSGGTSGGNIDYSLDGGNSWTLLNGPISSTYNWYTSYSLMSLFNEPGWNGNPFMDTVILDSTAIDISFLSGQTNVKFRFKYRNKWSYFGYDYPSGMHIDNFLINGHNVTSSSEYSISNQTFFMAQNHLYFITMEKFCFDGRLKFYNSFGELILNNSVQINNGTNQYSLPHDLASGIYIATIELNNGNIIGKIKFLISE